MTTALRNCRAGIAVAAALLLVLLACSPGARARRVPEGLTMQRSLIDSADIPNQSTPHIHGLAMAGGGNEDRPMGLWTSKLTAQRRLTELTEQARAGCGRAATRFAAHLRQLLQSDDSSGAFNIHGDDCDAACMEICRKHPSLAVSYGYNCGYTPYKKRK